MKLILGKEEYNLLLDTIKNKKVGQRLFFNPPFCVTLDIEGEELVLIVEGKPDNSDVSFVRAFIKGTALEIEQAVNSLIVNIEDVDLDYKLSFSDYEIAETNFASMAERTLCSNCYDNERSYAFLKARFLGSEKSN